MQRQDYPSDLTDPQWTAVALLIPPPAAGGRKREINMREVVNAIRYLRVTNCGWRSLPRSFPNRSTVRHYYDTWRQTGVWERIEAAVRTINEEPLNNPDYPDEVGTPTNSSGTS